MDDFLEDAQDVADCIAEFGDSVEIQTGETIRAIVDLNYESIRRVAGENQLALTGETPAVFYLSDPDCKKIGEAGLVEYKARTWKSGTNPDDPSGFSSNDVTFVRTLVFFLQPNSQTVGRVLNQWARIIKIKQGNVNGSISKVLTPAEQKVPCRVETATSETEGVTGEQVQATAKVKILLPLDVVVSARDRIAVGTEAQLDAPNQAGATIYEVIGADPQAADQTVQSIRVIRLEKAK